MVNKTLIMYDGETAIDNPIPGIQEQLDNHNKSLYNINNNIQNLELEVSRLEESSYELEYEIYKNQEISIQMFNSIKLELGTELARTNELLMEQIKKLNNLKMFTYGLGIMGIILAVAVIILY